MSGIIFHKTENLKKVKDFYVETTGAKVWLDQGKCIIMQHGNFLFGFCEGDVVENDGIITFFYSNATEVNAMYQKLQTVAEGAPRKNPRYRIYQFFVRDPEGRKIEFQSFLHNTEDYWTGSELLLKRRSIREFSDKEVADSLLMKVLEICRYSPTSRNSQAYYYVITRDKNKIMILADIRGGSSKPLTAAPIAIAVGVDSGKTKRPEQDACIAAYHLLLAAAQYGLGTCWITDMNRTEVKDILEIPAKDYIACLTPLGFPVMPKQDLSEERLRESDQEDKLPSRREVEEIFRFI